MCKGIRHYAALALLLQPIISDRRSRLKRSLNVARLDEVQLRLGSICPQPREAISLQFNTHLQVIG
jgi:hypothetical protein